MRPSKRTSSLTVLMNIILTLLTFPSVSVYAQSALTVELDSHQGWVRENITVSGTGAVAFGKVEIYWDSFDRRLKETFAVENGTYQCKITIPEDVAGIHYVIAMDVVSRNTNFTEFEILPRLVLSQTSGLPGDTVIVNGTGFAGSSNVTMLLTNTTGYVIRDVTPREFSSSVNGSFSSSFKVPVASYGYYMLVVKDAKGNNATETFRVGAIITLTPKDGPSGTIVTINGRGFTKIADKNVIITVDGVIARQITPVRTLADGNITGRFLVPTLDEGDHVVNATDEMGITSTTGFKVTQTTKIALTPKAGAPGTTVTIEGSGFTAIEGTKVSIAFDTVIAATLYTNSTGGFKEPITIPQLPQNPYLIIAIDENTLNATTSFRIAIPVISLEPGKGPTGTIVTVTGYGFTTGANADLLIGTVPVMEDINVTELEAGIILIIPTVPVGVYTLTAVDDEGLKALAPFEVTATTLLALTPSESSHNTTISIEATDFTYISGTQLSFTIKNSTWKTTLTVNPSEPWTAVETDETGSFKGTFEVPAHSIIRLGEYIVKAEDDYGLVAEAPLSIILPTVYIGTRRSEYMPGDLISFYVSTTFTCNFAIEIMGPLGFIRRLTISDADWQTVEDWKVVPYEKTSFTLPSDAELGLWNWSATLELVETSGSFTVVPPTSERLYEEITSLSSKISSLEENLTSISEKLEQMSSEIGALSEETLSSLRNEISNMQRDLEALKNHISSAETAAKNAQQAASSLTTITYIVLAISVAAAIAAILAFIAIIELGRMVTSGTKG